VPLHSDGQTKFDRTHLILGQFCVHLPSIRFPRAENNEEAFSVSERCTRKPDVMSADGTDELKCNAVGQFVLIDKAFDGCARLMFGHSGEQVDGQHHHLTAGDSRRGCRW
jgi:hypothetical protein